MKLFLKSSSGGQKSTDSARSRDAALGDIRRERPVTRLFRRVKRDLSSPAMPKSGGDRATTPRLFAARSADSAFRKESILARANGDGKLPRSNPVDARSGSSLFGRRKQKSVHATPAHVHLNKLRSEDSLLDENEGSTSSLNINLNESSRQLSKLFEEDPDSRSEMFMSLVAIENYD